MKIKGQEFFEGVTPLKWLLLTTMEISSFEQAVEKLGWYCIRWGIEVYHKTLKRGCKIEERQLDVITAMWKITMSAYISTRDDPLCPA